MTMTFREVHKLLYGDSIQHPNRKGFNKHEKGQAGFGRVPPIEHNNWQANQKRLREKRKRMKRATLEMQKRARSLGN